MSAAAPRQYEYVCLTCATAHASTGGPCSTCDDPRDPLPIPVGEPTDLPD